MSLLIVGAHRQEDLAAWHEAERGDRLWARSPTFRDRARTAIDDLTRFATAGADALADLEEGCAPCYASISWGKDSTVLAHLVWALAEARGVEIPLVHVRDPRLEDPYTDLVRDAFLRRWPHRYHEIVRGATGPLADEVACAMATGRYVTGIRAAESAARKRRGRGHGVTSRNTCAPLCWWQGGDVFAYLALHDLPVHPAYAMSFGGALDRDRIRVDWLRDDTDEAGSPGDEFGRAEWERIYYGGLTDGDGSGWRGEGREQVGGQAEDADEARVAERHEGTTQAGQALVPGSFDIADRSEDR